MPISISNTLLLFAGGWNTTLEGDSFKRSERRCVWCWETAWYCRQNLPAADQSRRADSAAGSGSAAESASWTADAPSSDGYGVPGQSYRQCDQCFAASVKGQELKIKMSESTICWKGQKVTVEGREGQKIRLVHIRNQIQSVRLPGALTIKI